MKDRPILFSAPMVRAILAGQKTQTRRPVKRGGSPDLWAPKRPGAWDYFDPDSNQMEEIACPYGEPGDRLWVRETWFELWDPDKVRPYDPPRYGYRATWEGEEPVQMDGDGFTEWCKGGFARSPWKPSIHMPRRASRLTLEVTGVRVERLREITEEDARAEGVERREHFARLWDEINGKGAFDSDPWVWVVEFKRVTP